MRRLNMGLVAILLCMSFVALANDPVYTTYEWEKNPTLSEISEQDSKHPAVIIKYERIVENHQTSKITGYTTEHKIVHINTEAGLEQYNKVYVPLYSGAELVDLHVRAIGTDGRITEIQKKNIKELENVEGMANVKIFAIEGLEIGGEAEYIYTLSGGIKPFGREVLQDNVPVKRAGFLLVYPNMFTMAHKSYNGLPEMKPVKVSKDARGLELEAENLPAYKEEEYATVRDDLQRVDYKLESNGYASNFFSWSSLFKMVVDSYVDRKTYHQAEKFLNDLDLEGLETAEQVKRLEAKIKSEISISESRNPDLKDLKEVLKNSVANDDGIMSLYLNCLSILEIEHELVFATPKYGIQFDQDFSHPMELQQTFIYLPELKKYLVPISMTYRMGPPLNSATGTDAWFISYNARKFPSGMVEVKILHNKLKRIEPLGTDLSHQGVRAEISLENGNTAKVSQENYYQGYRAIETRAILNFIDDDREQEFLKEVIFSGLESYDLQEQSLEGDAMDESYDLSSYLTIKSDYTSSELVEQAGPDKLISVGKVIGRQSELYQEDERKSDIVFHGTSNYKHVITLNIPEGYEVQGLESVEIDNAVEVDGEEAMYFRSGYEMQGNKLVITVREVYEVLNLPRDKYEEFRAVINSAADFSKATLVLTPLASVESAGQ